VSDFLAVDPVSFDSNMAICRATRLIAAYLWANDMETPPSVHGVASSWSRPSLVAWDVLGRARRRFSPGGR
jgi:hypothetical protein